jgi:adenine-specific DNA methylase
VLSCEASKSNKFITVAVREQPKSTRIEDGTVRRSSVTCPVCGYTTPARNVRKQFLHRKGGTADARLLAVVTKESDGSKSYRIPDKEDLAAVRLAQNRVSNLKVFDNNLSAIPNEPLPYLRSIFNINLLGVTEWGQLFTPRQALHLATFVRLARAKSGSDKSEIAIPVATCIGVALDKMADFHTSLARWIYVGEKIGNTFGRQALGIIWDYAEGNPLGDISGSWDRCVDYLVKVIEHIATVGTIGHVEQASAAAHPLPDDSASAFVTDPPYYDLVPYADLSDFFYVWLKRSIGRIHAPLFDAELTPKEGEIVQLAERNPAYGYKTRENFESLMRRAMEQSRRVLSPDGVGVVFFAHKGTGAWETQLQAMISAGWIIVGSWPLATEREGRLRAIDSAVLASSVQLVCRPRENPDGSVREDQIGDWRDVLQQLPHRIHEWMPRLAEEGVVGADAIFACLGPALEIFSRYSRVEKASGEAVTLKEYLEQVWAAVAKEALNMIFTGADASGFEEDARLTAMWLWTLNASKNGATDELAAPEPSAEGGSDADDADDETSSKKSPTGGFVLEYDAARKIAQGLGAHLEDLQSLVEICGDTARLLPVAARAQHLFGKDAGKAAPARRKREPQMDLFKAMQTQEGSESTFGDTKVDRIGATTLDRIHQSMILFAAGRGEALKRFLVEDGAGTDQRFWRLAQALSALYPASTEEKRWVDGVLARKKGLGF